MKTLGCIPGIKPLLVLSTVFFAGGCNTLRHIPEGKSLYTGADITIRSDEKIPDKKNVRKSLEQAVRPRPNKTFLGLRPKLWFYYMAGEGKKKGIRSWIKKKLGEPPVFFESVSPATTADILENKLHNQGYFSAKVSYKLIPGEKKTGVEYIVKMDPPYTISNIVFPLTGSILERSIGLTADETLLKSGRPYDLELLKDERARIDERLKNDGFFFFNPDFLLFRADTSVGNRKVDLVLQVKPETPSKAKTKYVLDDIYIFPDHSLGNDSLAQEADTFLIEGYHFVGSRPAVKPQAVIRSTFLEKGKTYSRKDHNLSLKRLMGMGVFKFVNIRFREDPADSVKLDCNVYLTPVKQKSVQVELEAVSKSNNFAGPVLIGSYKNRNLLKGAELYNLSVRTGFETQISGRQSGLGSYEISARQELLLPRFLVPFNIKKPSDRFVPKTKFDMGFRLLRRMQYFNINSFDVSYGYRWKENIVKEHEFNPLVINYTMLNKVTDKFKAILDNNVFLKRSFEEQFIVGCNYSFTRNTPADENRKSQYYFNGTADFSGNTLQQLQKLLNGRSDSAYTLFGLAYSQYSRFSADFRYYFNFSKKQKLGTRIIGGLGIPYGNSGTLPYMKQFFTGGPNSIRAFRVRSLGPGSYQPSDTAQRIAFLDQTGDIKLEGNVEYRFDIFKIIKGALFADAGNVWLIRENEDVPGGAFHGRSFVKEIAVGTGAGIRFDASFFILRFDLAFPLRKPYVQENNGWVIRQIDFGSGGWRRENLVLNIAIGYPF